ncbi:MAG: GNAT family N-acetyltransferase [Asgard group archaeon]|nr:GNAT family N-acetyltransferase [Asgard group archaeon]
MTMTIDISQLYQLRKKDVKIAAEVFTRAFNKDLLSNYMFPDEKIRKEVLGEYFKFRIMYGVIFGEVYASSPNIEGLAVWYHSDKYEMTNWKMFRAGGMRLFKVVDKETMNRMMKIGHFTTELRQENIDRSYWYLAPIGIDPQHQGKGLCSKLMRALLDRWDLEGISTALETQSEKNVELYRRYGYETIIKTTIPETDIPHFLMIRHPKK